MIDTNHFPYRIISTSDGSATEKPITSEKSSSKELVAGSIVASDEMKVLLAAIIAYKLKLSNAKVIPAGEILKSAVQM
ncbi:MAG: hypothetical protein KAH01_03045 [Caldisericia bacterium]|nr:hypothetical protein [Caldisericia bacterium]